MNRVPYATRLRDRFNSEDREFWENIENLVNIRPEQLKIQLIYRAVNYYCFELMGRSNYSYLSNEAKSFSLLEKLRSIGIYI